MCSDFVTFTSAWMENLKQDICEDLFQNTSLCFKSSNFCYNFSVGETNFTTFKLLQNKLIICKGEFTPSSEMGYSCGTEGALTILIHF